ncbi:zinc ribbon domain-containing protein, partial [Bacillus pseudomycoides]|uniref:zinc ribbon domain-containing protein n=1 Tax=Bacillus pseudomycoides TaxID=64104 RepID=UPI00352A726F
ISDAGWGAFRKMLLYKCKKFGSLLVKVDPAYTSQDCSGCGNRVKKITFYSDAYLCKVWNGIRQGS